MLVQQVLNTIKKHGLIEIGDGIVVGISGGYDSVCLLHILHSISLEFNLKLYPVHVNHLLRGEESLRDEEFAAGFCTQLGLKLHVKKIDIARKAKEEKISTEEAGRNARYEEFQKIAVASGAAKIAVAHSKNDQVETVLMRIFRGTGLEGLKGMEYQRDNIIRPLLDADRTQIEGYVNDNGLGAVTDSSNLHTDYLRNRVRLKVIPEINSSVGFDISENILRLSKIVVTDDDFLRYNSELYYKKCIINRKEDSVELSQRELEEIHPAMRSRVLRLAINDVCRTLNGIGLVHIDSALSLILNGKTGARTCLPHGVIVVKSYDSFIVKMQEESEIQNFEHAIEISEDTQKRAEISIGDSCYTFFAEVLRFETAAQRQEFIKENENVYTKFIDFEKLRQKGLIANPMIIRNRRDGDIFKPLNSNGTKKLKEYLIDNKIPREQRDSIPLFAAGKEILWMIGNKISDNYKVTDNTKAVLMISWGRKNIFEI